MGRDSYTPVPRDVLEAELSALERFLEGARAVYHMDRETADAIVSLLAELQKRRNED